MVRNRQGVNTKFIKLFRGLHEHLRHMDNAAFKLYINLLFHAYEHESTRGRVVTTNVQLARETGLSTDTVAKALKRLRDDQTVDEHGQIFGPYVGIEDHGRSKTITVLRWENPFAPSYATKKARRDAKDGDGAETESTEHEFDLADVPFD